MGRGWRTVDAGFTEPAAFRNPEVNNMAAKKATKKAAKKTKKK
jgi:hypothetical protein